MLFVGTYPAFWVHWSTVTIFGLADDCVFEGLISVTLSAKNTCSPEMGYWKSNVNFSVSTLPNCISTLLAVRAQVMQITLILPTCLDRGRECTVLYAKTSHKCGAQGRRLSWNDGEKAHNDEIWEPMSLSVLK